MAWCMQRIRIRRGCCRGRLTTRRNSLRVHMADIVWIRASLEPTLDDKGWRKSIDLVGLSVCIRVLSSNVSHQRLSARVHIFRIVLLENLLVHQSRIPCLLSKRRREERHLHRQQSGHKHRSYDRHTRSRIRHLRWQQQPVDEHMSRTEQTKHPDTNRQWVPNSQLPNIAFCIGVSSRVCGARNRIRKVSQRGRGHWGRIDANSLGTGSRRSLVNGRLEHAIMALAIEGVESIKCGKTDQEMDNKRRLKSSRLASTPRQLLRGRRNRHMQKHTNQLSQGTPPSSPKTSSTALLLLDLLFALAIRNTRFNATPAENAQSFSN